MATPAYDQLLHADIASNPDLMAALDAALLVPDGNPSPPAPAAEPTAPVPVPEPPPAPAAAPAAPAAVEPPSEPDATPNPLAKVAERYRTGRMSDLQKLATSYMADNPDITPSMAEVMAREELGLPAMGLQPVPPAEASVTAPEPAPAPSRAQPSAADLETRLAEIEDKLLEIGGQEGLNTRETEELRLEAMKLNAKLEKAQDHEAQAQADAAARHQHEVMASLTAAKAAHPDAVNPDSPLGREIAAVMDQYPEILDRGDAPLTVVKIAMANLGLTPVKQDAASSNASGTQQQQKPQVAAQQPVPAAPVIVPPVLPGGSRGAGALVPTVADLNATLGEMSADELTAVLARPTASRRMMPILR